MLYKKLQKKSDENCYPTFALDFWWHNITMWEMYATFNYFLASDNFCRLLIIFSNSLDQDQDRQNFGIDLVPKSKLLDTLIVLLKEVFEKVDFENCQQTTTKHEKKT